LATAASITLWIVTLYVGTLVSLVMCVLAVAVKKASRLTWRSYGN